MAVEVIPAQDTPDLETVTGELLGISYDVDTEPDTMILRLRVSASDAKRALPFRGRECLMTMGVDDE